MKLRERSKPAAIVLAENHLRVLFFNYFEKRINIVTTEFLYISVRKRNFEIYSLLGNLHLFRCGN